MKATEKQIRAKANEIGNRPVYPTANSKSGTGETYRMSLIRAAMQGHCSNPGLTDSWDNDKVADMSIQQADSLIYEMAKQELETE